MNLSKKSRKTQKAIRRALMFGLPVAGLLATVGCERKAVSESDVMRAKERTLFDGPMGNVRDTGGGFSDVDSKSDVGAKFRKMED